MDYIVDAALAFLRDRSMQWNSFQEHQRSRWTAVQLRGWANYFRHGVSKRAFNAIDSYTWDRITYWLRQKHRIGWPELRRRFCLPATWRLAHDGERFRGAATVKVTRYRYRGYQIPTP